MKRFDIDKFVFFWFPTSALIAIVLFLFIVLLSQGCCSANCNKIVYVPVEVKVPVPVEGPVLPLPEPPDCGEAPTEWRDAALYLKTCYDRLWGHIEDLTHVIVSYNETRVKHD